MGVALPCHLAPENASRAPCAPPVANVMADVAAAFPLPLTYLPKLTK